MITTQCHSHNADNFIWMFFGRILHIDRDHLLCSCADSKNAGLNKINEFIKNQQNLNNKKTEKKKKSKEKS